MHFTGHFIANWCVNVKRKVALPHLLGKAKPVWPAHGVVRGQSPLDHRIASSAASDEESAFPLVLVNELSTTPDDVNGEHGFTINHPFHPLCGQTFPLLPQPF